MASSVIDFLKGNDQKTALRKKKFSEGSARFRLYQNAKATLKSGINLKEIVKLPPGETLNDWLAVHVVDFFNRMEMLYCVILDVCDQTTCPTMSGGRYVYLWQDGIKYKKPTTLCAKDYIETLLFWIERQIHDEKIFPKDTNVDFPKHFKKSCAKIFSRMYRVFVHIYICHFERIQELNAEAHGNSFYKHFYYFTKEHELLEDKDFEPLEKLNERICHE